MSSVNGVLPEFLPMPTPTLMVDLAGATPASRVVTSAWAPAPLEEEPELLEEELELPEDELELPDEELELLPEELLPDEDEVLVV